MAKVQNAHKNDANVVKITYVIMYVGHCLCAIQEDDQQTDHLTCDFSRNWLLNVIFAIQLTISAENSLFLLVETFRKAFGKKVGYGQVGITIAFSQLSYRHLSGEAHFYQIGNIRLFKWIP